MGMQQQQGGYPMGMQMGGGMGGMQMGGGMPGGGMMGMQQQQPGGFGGPAPAKAGAMNNSVFF